MTNVTKKQKVVRNIKKHKCLKAKKSEWETKSDNKQNINNIKRKKNKKLENSKKNKTLANVYFVQRLI